MKRDYAVNRHARKQHATAEKGKKNLPAWIKKTLNLTLLLCLPKSEKNSHLNKRCPLPSTVDELAQIRVLINHDSKERETQTKGGRENRVIGRKNDETKKNEREKSDGM